MRAVLLLGLLVLVVGLWLRWSKPVLTEEEPVDDEPALLTGGYDVSPEDVEAMAATAADEPDAGTVALRRGRDHEMLTLASLLRSGGLEVAVTPGTHKDTTATLWVRADQAEEAATALAELGQA